MTTPLGAVEIGEGPPLVAVHGALTGGRLTFEGVADRWDRRVIIVDRPGHERTPGPEEPVGAQADRLLATIADRADGPVDAVGASFGGLVLLRAVQKSPEAFRSLVIVESATIDLCPPDMVEPTKLLRASQAAHARADADIHAAFEDLFGTVDPSLLVALRSWLHRDDPGLALLPGDLAIWLAMLDRYALAEAVSGERPIPVTAVSGTLSHPAFRTFSACTAAALAGTHRTLEGATHAAHLHPGFPALLAEHLSAAT